MGGGPRAPAADVVVDGAPPPDFGEFRANFLAEAEEHLQVIEHGVLDLEAELDREAADPSRVQELFRAVHTVKGLAAMLEFDPIVDLCHHLESVLRALERQELPFVSMSIDALIDGVRGLAVLIDDVRAGRELLAPAALLARLEELATLAEPTARGGGAAGGAGAPKEGGTARPASSAAQQLYEIRFAPTHETVTRGLSITTVREALGRVGEIVSVRPEVPVDGLGGISFVLLVASSADRAAVADSAGLPLGAVRRVSDGAGPAADGPRPMPVRNSSVVRVDISRLDELMRLVGELVIGRARVARAIAEVDASVGRDALFALQEASLRMERHLREMREAVMRVRMVPIREVFGRMPLVVRDTARAAGKEARIELVGEGTEVDKMLVDRLADPLVHLVRNAVDHGIEPPDVRRAHGKPESGLVRLRARQEGDRVVVEVTDDGRGIDRERVAARAAAIGFDAGDLASSDDAVLQVLCHPGFSTKEQASRTSGRGVGMDVVRQRIREMNGSLELETRPGIGSTFLLRLPLTLAIVEALTTICGGQRFAVPIASVEEVAEVALADVVRSEGHELIQHRGEVLPLLRLQDAFGLSPNGAGRSYLHTLIVDVSGARWAIGVDRLIGEQGVVVKPLADELVRTPGVVGATDLGDGELVLILDVPELVRARRDRPLAAPARRGETHG